MNRMGPKTEPCGTPHSRVTDDNSEEPIFTFWVQSVKYVAIQVLTVQVMPNQFVSLWSNIPVLTVLNATLRSSRTRQAISWFSIADIKSDFNL